jgi:hypothetical protein
MLVLGRSNLLRENLAAVADARSAGVLQTLMLTSPRQMIVVADRPAADAGRNDCSFAGRRWDVRLLSRRLKADA